MLVQARAVGAASIEDAGTVGVPVGNGEGFGVSSWIVEVEENFCIVAGELLAACVPGSEERLIPSGVFAEIPGGLHPPRIRARVRIAIASQTRFKKTPCRNP
jgi:hypothetical protein